MRATLALTLLLAALVTDPASADPTVVATELPAEVEARVVKTAEAELGHIERALRSQPGLDPAIIANVTLPLQSALEDDLGRGPVMLYPRAIYEACLVRFKKGEGRDAVGRELVDMHRRGELKRTGGAEPRRVASFVFDKERIKFPDPHLPASWKPPIGERTAKGVFLICVNTDGKISKVTPVVPIPGADDFLATQIETTWLYKPQPVPVCTPRQFIFQFN